MTRDRDKRGLSKSDLRLWRDITQSVKPLKNRPGRQQTPEIPPDPETETPHRPPAPPTPAKSRRATSPAAKPTSRPAPSPRLDLSGVDRRTRQRLGRGRIEVDARIDLHGLGQLEARTRLKAFLEQAHSNGLKWLLVITGKGTAPFARHTLHGIDYQSSPDRRGVLRDALARWLEEPEFRALVSGFQPAHPRHGGGGAFYLRLRRNRE